MPKRWSQATFDFALTAERRHRASANSKHRFSPTSLLQKLLEKEIYKIYFGIYKLEKVWYNGSIREKSVLLVGAFHVKNDISGEDQ